ncbi:AraC family transcriptional regulator [Nonomuraea sp. NPDC046570]|uniref:helix-turn-helix domain-containing protein n=1 Tax=Nonomuraea sp. NPDC046570 TaxID=3155255 RepID=UPI0033D9E0EF
MRTAQRVAAGPGFSVDAVTCVDEHRSWSEPESCTDHRLVLVRRGRFRRLADGVEADADPALAYVGAPGQEEHFAHPAGGDVCTALSFSPELWHRLAGDVPLRPAVYVDARLDLAHRRVLLAAARGDVRFGVVEELLVLLSRTLSQAAAGGPGTATPASRAHPRRHPGGTRRHPAAAPPSPARLVADAGELIASGHPAAEGLLTTAELLGVSPYRLSRAFTRELGVSLTQYRTRVRVGRALDRLEQGEPSLAALAADLGFSDQAHLTRTIHAQVGHTPAALRRLLATRRHEPGVRRIPPGPAIFLSDRGVP